MKLYWYKIELFNIKVFWHLTTCKQNLYLYLTEWAEFELFDNETVYWIVWNSADYLHEHGFEFE